MKLLKGGIIMATSSFYKDFRIKTERELNSLEKAFENPKSLKTDPNVITKEKYEEGIKRFRKQFSHLKKH